MEKQYYISKEDFQSLKAAWSKIHPVASSRYHVIYNVLRGKPANFGFHEKTKNIQGNDSWYAFTNAKYYAKVIARRWSSEEFKKVFGIDKPDDLVEKIDG